MNLKRKLIENTGEKYTQIFTSYFSKRIKKKLFQVKKDHWKDIMSHCWTPNFYLEFY